MLGRIPNGASWCWKGIMQTRNLLSKGLINQDSRTWKEDLVRNLFDPPSAQAILNMHIPQREGQDVAIWTPV